MFVKNSCKIFQLWQTVPQAGGSCMGTALRGISCGPGGLALSPYLAFVPHMVLHGCWAALLVVKYFLCQSMLCSSWDQVFAAFWQQCPNPYSRHVLREDTVQREVTPDQELQYQGLLTRTSRVSRESPMTVWKDNNVVFTLYNAANIAQSV